jgi:DNA helicase HerA-like ATPase
MARILPRLAEFNREEFFTERWRYRKGEHLTILGPTGSGKTFLTAQLLRHTATPELPAIIMVVKPKDDTVDEWAKTLDYPILRDWPPTQTQKLRHGKKRGWIVWPKHEFDPIKDDEHLFVVMRKTILDAYKAGSRILLADEVFALAPELRLERELRTLWMRGRSMGTGLWAGTQKPAYIPTHAYDQASHLFLSHTPDERVRERFDEIGGVEPRLVEDLVMSLGKHEFLYIRRDGPVMCKLTKE